jgi:hypothetical protein
MAGFRERTITTRPFALSSSKRCAHRSEATSTSLRTGHFGKLRTGHFGKLRTGFDRLRQAQPERINGSALSSSKRCAYRSEAASANSGQGFDRLSPNGIFWSANGLTDRCSNAEKA